MDCLELAKKYRTTLLSKLVKSILAGKFMHRQVDPNKLYQTHTSERREYLSPVDRSDYNYGYKTIGEMGNMQTEF